MLSSAGREQEQLPREELMKRHAAVVALVLLLPTSYAQGEKDGVVRIGVLNDMSSVYADFQGPGSVVAAQLAVADFAGHSKRKAEVLPPHPPTKPDLPPPLPPLL